MEGKKSLIVTSPAFAAGGSIPAMFTCEGEDKSPELNIDGIPAETKSLVLIMDDPDAPGKTFDHWVMWNIKPQRTIHENSTPGQLGKNSLGKNAWMGPCPPSGTHRYFFKVYALDTMLQLHSSSDKKTVENAMRDHIIGYGELMGNYRKQKSRTLNN